MLLHFLGVLACAFGSSPYSFSPTTFDPTGRLQQIEFAFKAIGRSGTTAAAIVLEDGVVLASCEQAAEGADDPLRAQRRGYRTLSP